MTTEKDARVWLKANGYAKIANKIDAIMAEWRKRGVKTRRNWWDILAGDREGRPRNVGSVAFPVLAAARRRKGWPPCASEIGSGQTAPALVLSTDGKSTPQVGGAPKAKAARQARKVSKAAQEKGVSKAKAASQVKNAPKATTVRQAKEAPKAAHQVSGKQPETDENLRHHDEATGPTGSATSSVTTLVKASPKATPCGPEHILKELYLPDRYERLVERLGHEVVQVLVPPPTPIADALERCYLAVRTRDEGLFVPLYGTSGAGKTTLAASLTHFFPSAYAPTAVHDGKVTYDALSETAENALRDRKADDRRILPISIDNRESDPPTTAELAAIKRFVRNAKTPIRSLIIWLDTSKENCQDMAQQFEDVAGPSPVALPLIFEGPPRSMWQDVTTNTLRLVNSVESLEELGINPRDYDPKAYYSLGNFLRKISGDFDDRRFKLLKETQRPLSLVVVFASESQEPGILTQLTSTSRYGLVDGHALVSVTPTSELGKWWSLRHGLLTRAIVQLNVHAFCLPPSAAVGVLRRYGPDKARKLLHKNGVRQLGLSRLNLAIERSDMGKYFAGAPIRAYEARGTPAKLSVKAFAAVAKSGFVYGKDKALNEGFASAMREYLKHRNVKHEKVTAEKQLSFCGLTPDNALYMETGVQCIEYHWRTGDFLVSANRAEVASYILRKIRDYVRQLEWTKD